MWQQLKLRWHEFRNDPPGERFRNSFERQRKRGGSLVATIITVVIGGVLVVAGFLLGLIPGVPGIVLGLIGIALIATRFRRMSLWMDSAEVRLRRFWEFIRQVKAKGSRRAP